jgi:hypothetical protein
MDKKLLLFEKTAKSNYRFVGEFRYVNHSLVTARDTHGAKREMISTRTRHYSALQSAFVRLREHTRCSPTRSLGRGGACLLPWSTKQAHAR